MQNQLLYQLTFGAFLSIGISLSSLKAQYTIPFDSLESLSSVVTANFTSANPIVSNAFTSSITTSYDPSDYTTGNFKQGTTKCPSTGKGSGDPALSLLKNRDKSAPTYYKATVQQLINLSMPDAGDWEIVYTKKHRDEWSTAIAAEVDKLESKAVVIEGYFLFADDMSAEHCNCGSSKFVDDHLWLVDQKPHFTTLTGLKTLRPNSVVAEISPRLHGSKKDRHRNYYQTVVKQLAKKRIKVRVYGWLTWDQEHKAHIGQTRATLFEIHPVHKIEVEVAQNDWRDLDDVYEDDLFSN